MNKNYLEVSPIQQQDQSSCWAASLAWWLQAMGGSRPQRSQLDLLVYDYFDLADTDDADLNSSSFGTISQSGLEKVFGDPRWRMGYETIPGSKFTPAYLTDRTKLGPALIGYLEDEVGGLHVNGIFTADKEDSWWSKNRQRHGHVTVYSLVCAMDPNFAMFRFRPYSHYNRCTTVTVAWPR
jgi:hypothetical protein